MKELIGKLDINHYLPTALNWAGNVLLALIILVIGLWISGKAYRAVVAIANKHAKLDDTLFRFFGSLARYAILAFVGIAVLNRFGVQTASIIALLGAAGLAVGLALQGTLTNLAAGVMLLIFRPYKVNDLIDVAGTFGKVVEIDMFTTILQTFDKKQIIIPNGKIWGDQIVNHSHNEIRGVDMTFGIAYRESIDDARQVIEKVLRDHPLVLDDPAPFVEVATLNNSSVDFLVRPFCEGQNYFAVRYSVPEQIKKALDAAHIEIPFPHRKVIIARDD